MRTEKFIAETTEKLEHAKSRENWRGMDCQRHKLAVCEFMQGYAENVEIDFMEIKEDGKNAFIVTVYFYLFGKSQKLTFSSFETVETESGEPIFVIS